MAKRTMKFPKKASNKSTLLLYLGKANMTKNWILSWPWEVKITHKLLDQLHHRWQWLAAITPAWLTSSTYTLLQTCVSWISVIQQYPHSSCNKLVGVSMKIPLACPCTSNHFKPSSIERPTYRIAVRVFCTPEHILEAQHRWLLGCGTSAFSPLTEEQSTNR
jgi:hypothetical protein